MFLLRRGVVTLGGRATGRVEGGGPLWRLCSSASGEGEGGDETIIDRLKRLSVTRPEEFEPTAVGERLQKAKGRYRRILQEYENRFAMKEEMRYRAQQGQERYQRRGSYEWGGGGGNSFDRRGGGDSWRGYGQFREMSTFASSPSQNQSDFVAPPLVKKGKLKKTVQKSSDDVMIVEKRRDDARRSRSVSEPELLQSTATLDESDALLHLGNDADTFGTLVGGGVTWRDVVGVGLEKELKKEEAGIAAAAATSSSEIEDDDDASFYPTGEQKWTMKKLMARVKELAEQQKVTDAALTLDSALALGGFHYTRADITYLYNIVISLSATLGHVDLTFKLFNDMKKRGFPPKPSTYTSLFNACANAVEYKPREEMLDRVARLRSLMADKGVVPNLLNYHAMMKAYGRCGDLIAAFQVVDEMIRSEVKPTTETFNFLLQACLSDSVGGFRHALVTWRKMQGQKGIRPDLFSYNLFLRVVRECGVGQGQKKKGLVSPYYVPPVTSDEEADEILRLVVGGGGNNPLKALEGMTATSKSAIVPRNAGELLTALEYPENRLAVLGGLRGLFTQMAGDRVGPNLKTLNELALIIHPNEATDLLVLLKTYKLPPTIDLFNTLLKRSYVMMGCGGQDQARNLLKLLPSFNLTPNIVTWGVCALGVRSLPEAEGLLREMDQAKFTPNVQVMGGLLCSASGGSCDPDFVLFVMDQTRQRGVKVDGKFVLQLEAYRQKMRRAIVKRETGGGDDADLSQKMLAVLDDPEFDEKWGRFIGRFNFYMRRVSVGGEVSDPWREQYVQFVESKKNRSKKEFDDRFVVVGRRREEASH